MHTDVRTEHVGPLARKAATVATRVNSVKMPCVAVDVVGGQVGEESRAAPVFLGTNRSRLDDGGRLKPARRLFQ